MTYKQAKKLRDLIRADGIHCIIPVGQVGKGHVARIFTKGGPRDFRSVRGYRTYCTIRDGERALVEQWIQQQEGFLRQPRSPIEAMIDKACGLT